MHEQTVARIAAPMSVDDLTLVSSEKALLLKNVDYFEEAHSADHLGRKKKQIYNEPDL